MALIKCPECSREISDKAEACPHCGFPTIEYLEKDKLEQCAFVKSKEEVTKKERLGEEAIKLNRHDRTKEVPKFGTSINKTLLYGTIGLFVIFFVYMAYSNKVERANINQQEIIQIRNSFNASKKLWDSDKGSGNELSKIKKSFESVKIDMPEYKEAQELLVKMSNRVAEADIEWKSIKSRENKPAEESLYTKAGKKIKNIHPEWGYDTCNAIGKREIYIGMTAPQVRAAWGRPYKVNTTINAYGTNEQWVMHENGNTYVYFDDGICTSIQN